MTTTINADTIVGGAVVTADASGELALQAAGVTKLTVNSSGVTLAAPLPVASGGTGGSATPTAGGVVYGTGTVQAVTAAGTSGQLLQSNGASAPTWATISAGLTLGTPVNSTSGTAITFTGIPAGVKMIVINLAGVSTNGSSELQIQLGDSGGIETTGYVVRSSSIDQSGVITIAAPSTGFAEAIGNAQFIRSGMVTLVLQNASTNNWVANGHWVTGTNGATVANIGGYKPLSDVLTQVRITSVSADTFDAGAINIAYM